jgi:hypothetical protein
LNMRNLIDIGADTLANAGLCAGRHLERLGRSVGHASWRLWLWVGRRERIRREKREARAADKAREQFFRAWGADLKARGWSPVGRALMLNILARKRR